MFAARNCTLGTSFADKALPCSSSFVVDIEICCSGIFFGVVGLIPSAGQSVYPSALSCCSHLSISVQYWHEPSRLPSGNCTVASHGICLPVVGSTLANFLNGRGCRRLTVI